MLPKKNPTAHSKGLSRDTAKAWATTLPLSITYARVGVRWNEISAIQTDAAVTSAVTSGMPGSGVFNKYGELVGMLYSTSTKNNVNARILLTDEIAEIMPKLKAGRKE